MFIFACQVIVSEKNTLLVMGYGCKEPSQLNEALLLLRNQIEVEKDRVDKMADPVAIDFWLAQKSRLFAIDGIHLVALSLNNHTVQDVGGGVIGSPFERMEPARSQLEFIEDNVCIVAFPESPGLALIGIDKEQIDDCRTYVRELDGRHCDVSDLLLLAKRINAEAGLVIFDGCGRRQKGGGLFIRKLDLHKIYSMPKQGVDGKYWLDVYKF